MFHIVRFVLLFLLMIFLFSCSSRKQSAALKSFEIGEYHRAEGRLKLVYNKEKNKFAKGQHSFYLGECYRMINMPKKAASSYNKAVRNKYSDPLALLYMAESYRKSGDYGKALEGYQQYLEKKSFDVLAQNGILSCQMAMGAPIAQAWRVEKAKMFNSKNSDFAPALTGSSFDQIYFTSMRTVQKKRKLNRITGQGNSSIFVSHIDGKGEWTKPERMEEPISSAYDDGTPNMSSDGKTMFFTRCPYVNTQANTAQVFEVERSGGRWGEPVRIIPGGDSTMVAHPAISPDGNTLYFVSDRAGGFGGKDIYKSDFVAGEWSAAVNMGSSINTPGDEMYPYVRSDGTLYFCSNGHIGFGGLDIFRVETDEQGRQSVRNMGKPLNSESDDFGIVFEGKRDAGFFSSSRGSAKGYDDIFSFALPEVNYELLGNIQFPSHKRSDVVNVRLIGTDGSNQKLVLGTDGAFGCRLEKNTDYVLLASAEGFYNAKENFSTRTVSGEPTIKVTLKMGSADEVLALDAIYFVSNAAQPLDNCNNIIERAANYLLGNAKYRLDIRCHTAQSGNPERDVELADKRGQFIESLLIQKGVAEARLTIDAVGAQEPAVVTEGMAAQNSTLRVGDAITPVLLRRLRANARKEAEQLNDRVELVLMIQ